MRKACGEGEGKFALQPQLGKEPQGKPWTVEDRAAIHPSQSPEHLERPQIFHPNNLTMWKRGEAFGHQFRRLQLFALSGQVTALCFNRDSGN